MRLKVRFNQSIKKIKSLNQQPRPISRDELASYIIGFEAAHSTSTLQQLLPMISNADEMTDVEAIKDIVRPLVTFLSQRWENLKAFPQLHYTTNYNDPLTDVCLTLATDIANLKIYYRQNENDSFGNDFVHRFEFLMPGINFENLLTTVNLNQQDNGYDDVPGETLQLHQFILDDQFRIIHIRDCFKVAEPDLQFMHTSALSPTGNLILLNEIDRSRVIHHSKESREVWRAIEALDQYKKITNTLGGALARLANALKDAGINGTLGGSDNKASGQVFIGIKAFYGYFSALPGNLREYLLKLKISEQLDGSFEFIYYKLMVMANYSEANEASSLLSDDEVSFMQDYIVNETQRRLSQRDQSRELRRYIFASCVNEISSVVTKFLERYPSLYDISPTYTHDLSDESVAIRLDQSEVVGNTLQKQHEKRLNMAYKALAVSADKLNPIAMGELKSLNTKKVFLINETDFLREFCRGWLLTGELFFQQITFIPIAYKREFMTEIMKSKAISKLFPDYETLRFDIEQWSRVASLQEKSAVLKAIIDVLGSAKLKQLICKPQHLFSLKDILPVPLMTELVESILDPDHIKKIFSKDEAQIRRFINIAIPEAKRSTLCTLLGISLIPNNSSSWLSLSVFRNHSRVNLLTKRSRSTDKEENEVSKRQAR